MTTIGLVACSKLKLNHPAPARELYTSPLFRAASAYCERSYDRWLILSALYGLVRPDDVIEPYDVTLVRMTRAERTHWAIRVHDQAHELGLDEMCVDRNGPVRMYAHAGAFYRQACNPRSIIAPLAGLGIGQQLHWYAVRGIR